MTSGQHYHDEPERRKWQNPEEILARIGLREGDTFIDVGCGEGFFSLIASKIVGSKGRIIGIDINQEAILRMQKRAKKEGMDNIIIELENAEESPVCRSCADFVFFGINLHDFENPGKALLNARDMLKPDGKLIDLDWKKKPMSIGPPISKRFDEKYAKQLIENAGFNIETIEASGKMHYLIIARIDPKFSD